MERVFDDRLEDLMDGLRSQATGAETRDLERQVAAMHAAHLTRTSPSFVRGRIGRMFTRPSG